MALRVALLGLIGACARADTPTVDLWQSSGPGGGTMANTTSMWGPSLVVTNDNTTLAFGQCDRSPTRHDSWMAYRRSHDGGATWEPSRPLYGCGSPAALYSHTTDTVLVFFTRCTAPGPKPAPGPPYGMSAQSCAGGAVHWQYDAAAKTLRSRKIAAPASPLGVRVCEGAVKPAAGDSLAVGMPPDAAEACPAVDLRWTLDNATGFVRHDDTGLCLTIPPRKSAVLQPCGWSPSSSAGAGAGASGEGQRFEWDGDTLKLAASMYRAGECLGYLNNSGTGAGTGTGTGTGTSTGTGADAAAAAADGAEAPAFNLCTQQQDLVCNMTRYRDVVHDYPACRACVAAHKATLTNATVRCTEEQMQTYCGTPIIDPAPHGSGAPDAGTDTVVMTSADAGATWSAPRAINVTNTWGPHYAGNDVAHGVELRHGAHAGRLAIARRYDSGKGGDADFVRSYVLYSDDQGASWAAGQLLPRGWTECQAAELRNGSLVLTSRLTGLSGFYCQGWNASNNLNCFQRGFARSDDGGATWAAVWYLEERSPGVLVNNCENALASDPDTGTLYWGHPGAANMTRANYTVHSSDDGGLTWRLLDRVYEHGAGYSDVHVLRDPATGAKFLGALFQRTLYEPGAEGGGYNLALARVPLSS